MKKFMLTVMIFVMLLVTGCSKITLVNKNWSKGGEYLLPSDSKVITEVDLSKLNDTELQYAFEEIYARHGKIYNDENYKKYFNSQGWYKPDPTFSEKSMSALEKDNLQFIYDYINNKGISNSNIGNNLTRYDYDYYYNTYRGDDSYIIPDSSVRKLTTNELYGCSSQLLALIRNEIYARNGYVFSKKEYRDYFSSKSWYTPNPDFNESWLNSTEKYNIQLIKSLE